MVVKVTTYDCAAFRILRDDGFACSILADRLGYNRETVGHHAYGHCTHDHHVPACDSEPPTVNITAYDCAAIRLLRGDGIGNNELADRLGCDHSSITYHAYGHCTHDHHVPALEDEDRPTRNTGKVTTYDCASIRFLKGDGMASDELADRLGCAKSTVTYHASGECSHDHHVPSANSAYVTAEMCATIRRRFATDAPDELAAEFSVGCSTIRAHAFGDCSHTHDTPPIDRAPSPRREDGQVYHSVSAYGDGHKYHTGPNSCRHARKLARRDSGRWSDSDELDARGWDICPECDGSRTPPTHKKKSLAYILEHEISADDLGRGKSVEAGNFAGVAGGDD